MRYLLFLVISYSYIFANAHIFVYHRFGDNNHQSTNTTIKELEKEFEYFKQNNYTVVPLKDIIQKINNKEEVPEKWIALTIDDAYKSFYTYGLEVFKKYNYPFTLYVYVEATNKKYGDFMTWEELKVASKYGSIGLHSYGHPHLTHLTNEEIYQDTKKALDIFTKKMGYSPTTYAYPYGEYNERVQTQLKKFNFNAILNQSTGSITKDTDTQDIHRLALVGVVNIEQKLRYKTFDVQWIAPFEFPKDGILKQIKAKVDPKYKKLKLYITGEGWRDIKVNNGIIDIKLNIYLKKARTRVMLGSNVFNISNNIIIKQRKTNGK
ncbi:MAG: polysaccharide deacetylase family protein [Arcobacteraceae bacterium]|nr:polysaccharide deacetylase family protein [Arcobacteraceae bacterium]